MLGHQRVPAQPGNLRGRRRVRQHAGLVHVRLSARPDTRLVAHQVRRSARGDLPPALSERPVQPAAGRHLQKGHVLLHGRRRLGQ